MEKKMKIKIKKAHPNAVVPTYAKARDKVDFIKAKELPTTERGGV